MLGVVYNLGCESAGRFGSCLQNLACVVRALFFHHACFFVLWCSLTPRPIMETLNPLLASALEFMREGNVEAAEAGFGEAASACCEAYGEARHIFVCVHRFFESFHYQHVSYLCVRA